MNPYMGLYAVEGFTYIIAESSLENYFQLQEILTQY